MILYLVKMMVMNMSWMGLKFLLMILMKKEIEIGRNGFGKFMIVGI